MRQGLFVHAREDGQGKGDHSGEGNRQNLGRCLIDTAGHPHHRKETRRKSSLLFPENKQGAKEREDRKPDGEIRNRPGTASLFV